MHTDMPKQPYPITVTKGAILVSINLCDDDILVVLEMTSNLLILRLKLLAMPAPRCIELD
jgi:hypothetical protein